VAGLSASGSAAPAMPASTAARRPGGDAAVSVPMTTRLTSPSGTATRRNLRRLPQFPQCGTESRTKCEATPAANAGTGRRASAPIRAPDKT
jgi:hypothetical protein